jgi:hypothetical protein
MELLAHAADQSHQLEYYRKRGRLGFVQLVIRDIRWKGGGPDTKPEKVSKIKILSAIRSKKMTQNKLLNFDSANIYIGEASELAIECEWKCWLNSQFKLVFFLESTGNTPKLLTSDPIIVESLVSDRQVSLFSKTFETRDATVSLSLKFFPNTASFSYICLSAESNLEFYREALDELKEIINEPSLSGSRSRSSHSAGAPFITSKVDKELLLLSIKYLKDRVNNPELLLSLMPHRSAQGRVRRSSFGSVGGSSLPSTPVSVSSELTAESSIPVQYNSHLVAGVTKRFLQEIFQNLPQVSRSRFVCDLLNLSPSLSVAPPPRCLRRAQRSTFS